jgi:protein ImuB
MFAVIYIPNFSLQAMLRGKSGAHSLPAALADGGPPSPKIIQANAAAKASGVEVGMTHSQAMARCEMLEIASRSPGLEAAAETILLQTAHAFSPYIESTHPGVCTIDLKGLGLDNPAAMRGWSRMILTSFNQLQFEARIGIGPTPDLALLAAHGPEGISIVEKPDEFVAALPVAALSPPPDMLHILARWGIRTAGEFLALGKNEIAARLGADALKLFHRVSPDSSRPLNLVSPSETFLEQIEFEGEIETIEPLLLRLRHFVELLLGRLDTIHLVVAQFKLRLGLSSGSAYEHIFKIPAPTSDPEILFRMLQTHLENLRTDSPIISLYLAAIPCKPEMHQFGLFQNTLRNPNQFAETLARLTALVGSENAGTPVLEATHRPDSFQMQPPDFQFVPAQGSKNAPPNDSPQFRRFRPPVPARFEFQANLPARVHSPVFTGPIDEIRGPYLSSGHWWDDNRWTREEWDAEIADGQVFRLVRSHAGCFVEGVYD